MVILQVTFRIVRCGDVTIVAYKILTVSSLLLHSCVNSHLNA